MLKNLTTRITIYRYKKIINKAYFCIRLNCQLIEKILKDDFKTRYKSEGENYIVQLAFIVSRLTILDKRSPANELFYTNNKDIIDYEINNILKNERIRELHLRNLLLRSYCEARKESSEEFLARAMELNKDIKPLIVHDFRNNYKSSLTLHKALKTLAELENIKKLDKKPHLSIGQWLEISTKVSGLTVSLSFLCSLIYDWGFFEAFGLSFLDLPSTITDHLRSTLIWFPLIASGLGISIIFELTSQRIERGKTEEEIIKESSNPEWLAKFRESPYKFLQLLAILAVILYLLFGDFAASFIPFALVILWVTFSFWLHNHPRILLQRGPVISRFIIIFPAILIFLGFHGYATGKKMIIHKEPDIQINLKEPTKVLSAIRLRFFEKGVLVMSLEENKPEFFKWEEISSIDLKKRDDLIYKGILSKWLKPSKQ